MKVDLNDGLVYLRGKMAKLVEFGIWVFWGGFGVTCAVRAKAPDKAPVESGSGINQILGIKGAKQETVSHQFAPLIYKLIAFCKLKWFIKKFNLDKNLFRNKC